MAFSNEEVMRATELALRQYHVVKIAGPAVPAGDLTLGGKTVDLYTEGLLRSYGYILYNGVNWINETPRVNNPKLINKQVFIASTPTKALFFTPEHTVVFSAEIA